MIISNHIQDNSIGLHIVNGQPVVNGNAFENNTNYGIRNTSTQIVNARYNWWGDPSGPFHPALNPNGLGDRVSDNVTFSPWLDLPSGNQPVNLMETDYSILIYSASDATYTRIYPDNTVIHFNSDGTHDYTLSPDGVQLQYAYNPGKTLSSINIIPSGETSPRWTWTFHYIEDALDHISDPAGRITTFTINNSGQLTQVVYPDSGSSQFYYDSNNLLTQQLDENGDVSQYFYDQYGRLTAHRGPLHATYDHTSGITALNASMRTFTNSDTSYPLINNSTTGNPVEPAPQVTTSNDLVIHILYERGERSGFVDKWGNWLQYTNAIDQTISFERDNSGLIRRYTRADGSCINYVYDHNGHVLSETWTSNSLCVQPLTFDLSASGPTWSYTYEPEFQQIKTETDPLGNTVTYFYDYEEGIGNAGKLIRIEYPPVPNEFGLVVTPVVSYTYNAWGLIETETDARGTVTKYIYTQGTPDEAYGQPNAVFAPGVMPVPGLLTQIIEDFGGINLTTIYRDFDGAGNAIRMIGPGVHLTTTYAFDDMNRVLSQTDAVGIVTAFTYDGRGNLTSQITDYTVDGISGRNIVTEYTYNAYDEVLTERTTDGGLSIQTSTVYDANQKVALTQDGRGYETVYLYNDADQLVNTIDPAGQVVTYTYTLNGQLEAIIDADGYATHYTYDSYERLVTIIEDSGGLNLTTQYAYDLNGNILTITDTVGTSTCYAYDSHNRQTSETLDCGGLDTITTWAYDVNNNTRYLTDIRGTVTYYEYDDLNRLTQMRLDDGGLNLTVGYAYDTAGNLYRQTDERGVITEYLYDDLNRITSSCQDRLGLNLCSLYSYDRLNNQTTVTDPNGIITHTDYNGFNLPTRVTEDTGGLNASTNYSYDSALNLIRITDANLNITQYVYDVRNLLRTEIYADGTTVDYSYDGRGNLAIRTDQDSNTTTHGYDGVGRLIMKAFSTGGWQRYDYDDAGRVTQAEEQMNGHHSLLTFSYNNLSDVVSTTQSLDNYSWSVDYAYDYVSGVYTITYPSGAERVQTLDSIGRLDTVHQGNGTLITDYDYHDLNSYMTVAYPNGLNTRTDYDTLYRTTRISSAIADYRYGYDNAGNRSYMQRWHETNHPSDVYQYDNLYQLTQVWYGADR